MAVFELSLTPEGILKPLVSEEADPTERKWADPFFPDWRAGLFFLASEKRPSLESPTLDYWRRFASHFLTGLCHLPEESKEFQVPLPGIEILSSLLFAVPPMAGGEYLTIETLQKIWLGLNSYAVERSREFDGVGAFLRDSAPEWNLVGRVTFHLAENKGDEQRPFAFMASFTTGFAATGDLKYLPLGKALEKFGGEKNRSALIRLLQPVSRAATKLPWVQGLIDSGEIYSPRTWESDRAHEFLISIPTLEDNGLSVRIPDWWKQRARPRVGVTVREKRKSVVGADALLDFDVGVALGEENLSPSEIQELLREGQDGLVFFKGKWIEVDRERLREALDHWEKLKRAGGKGLTLIEGLRLLAGAERDLRGGMDNSVEKSWVVVRAGGEFEKILAGLRDPAQLIDVAHPPLREAELRPYQKVGLKWLHFLARLGLGACLADDMGLGKTIQVLALLLIFKKNGEEEEPVPSLLVVPASLLGNWRREAERFAPDLRIRFAHSAEADREEMARAVGNPVEWRSGADLVITTYSQVARQEWLTTLEWRLAILDEAQAIKNPQTQQARAVKLIKSRGRLALTGTPVENRLGDLWSLFDFLNPGLLGSQKVFQSFIDRLKERPTAPFAPLRQLVAPYILRRLKTDKKIIDDLPEKTEIIAYCQLTPTQAKLYARVVEEMRRGLDENPDPMERRGLILKTLLRLKQVCNHPAQLTGEGDFDPEASGKFRRLAEFGDELAQRQERLLVFTQFREIIPSLADHLSRVFGREGLVLHGGTAVKKRQDLVERFQASDGPPFFILSLKAGGTGLNLTSAARVIHFDRWWNPAVEDQATDRAFRIGQKKNVMVHKFVTRGTLEERINALLEEKKGLAREVIEGEGEVNLTELNDREILKLVALDLGRATLES